MTWNRYSDLFDFSNFIYYKNYNYLPANNGWIKPFFSFEEGTSATVDMNGDLHFLCTMLFAKSNHIDSLDLTYNVDFNQTWRYIVDLRTQFNVAMCNGWDAVVIDSLKCSGPTSAQSNWYSSSGNLAYNARLQISRTRDGSKLFYSWADSNPAYTINNASTAPDIQMVGLDILSGSRTLKKNVTVSKSTVSNNAYWFLTSPIVMASGNSYTVPTMFTASNDGSMSGDNPVSYYYMNDNTFTDSDFNQFGFWGCYEEVSSLKKNDSNLNLYPNPASTFFNFIDFSNSAVVKIFNQFGVIVLIKNNEIKNIDISNLPNGVYYVELETTDEKVYRNKLIISK